MMVIPYDIIPYERLNCNTNAKLELDIQKKSPKFESIEGVEPALAKAVEYFF
jgi:hypothetical protein